MPDIIHLLPDSIANQIAAGEVIQRPASAVKELMENSLDAGATHIKLIVKDAGKQLIQVIDNGCGMSDTDARMSFERHATSKISTIDDLFAIRTMGFRGEALASIAAIAQVELKSKRREETLGCILEIEGSEVKKQEAAQVAEGTSISVKNLFFNVPARRTFLKANPVEMRHIIDEFQRIALANPEIHFELHHNGLMVFGLPPANLRQRIVNILGNHYNERLVPVEEQTSIVNIFGFIGKPESAKKTRGDQFFFVNRRFIRSAYLNHAVTSAYDQLLQKDSFPLYVIFMDIDPSKIDINVHPTKQEIKFDDEKIVYAFVNSAVKRALAKFSITPTLDFDRETAFDRLEAFSNFVLPPETSGVSKNPGGLRGSEVIEKKSPPVELNFFKRPPVRNWEQLYEITKNKEATTVTLPSEISQHEKEETAGVIEDFSEKQLTPFQIHHRYIVTQIKSGFILIDQQAAHERILFEKYLDGLQNNNLSSQQQLFPETIHINASDIELLKELLPELRVLGFDIQEFGGNSFVAHGLPSDIKNGGVKEIIESMLDEYKQSASQTKFNKRDQLAYSMAKRASVKSGDVLSEKEMRHLIDQLFACKTPYVAPNGKLTILTFDLDEVGKLFEKGK
ncbi:MAG TPA: DNA mismatch repair endonuclease MutL [Chitinophagales bacterium]|nr:DNA mismatch repair endonuclease MutL [Chitinophagales bacterium]